MRGRRQPCACSLIVSLASDPRLARVLRRARGCCSRARRDIAKVEVADWTPRSRTQTHGCICSLCQPHRSEGVFPEVW